MTPKEYQSYVKQKQKKSPLAKNLLLAFVIGGFQLAVWQPHTNSVQFP